MERQGFKGKALTTEIDKYRWNYVEEKKYPCNETHTIIKNRLDKVENISETFLTRDIEQELWHLIYSVTDKTEYEKALVSFSKKHNIDTLTFVETFKKCPPFKSEYGSFSEKAIKKLLPLMRIGKYWRWDNIDRLTQMRIEKIISGEYDKDIKNRVREKVINLASETHFQGLQLWLAQYIVYDCHSEALSLDKWESIDDIDNFLQSFRQHSLKNPIVEQVVTEPIRVVKDIWSYFGNGSKDYLNEIHVELGRDMKLPAEDRKIIQDKNYQKRKH